MLSQFDRFLYWLAQGQNAAAVQAVTAIVSSVITAFLFYLTWMSIRVSVRMASVAQAQLESTVQPNLEFRVVGVDNTGLAEVTVTNNGATQILLGNVMVKAMSIERDSHDKEIGTLDLGTRTAAKLKDVILNPQDYISESLWFEVPGDTDWARGERWSHSIFSLSVECSDARGFVKHTYLRAARSQMRYFPYHMSDKVRPRLSRWDRLHAFFCNLEFKTIRKVINPNETADRRNRAETPDGKTKA